MSIDYTLAAGILLYFIVIRMVVSTRLNVLAACLIVVLGYLGLGVVIDTITGGFDGAIAALAGLGSIVLVILQFIVALFSFYKMQENDESYSAWIGWGVAGCLGIFFVAPYAVRMLGLL